MADYYPLISRAIAGLKEDTHETRRAVYQKARVALDHQLRAVRPALSESDIARERLALDEAIGKIEAERTRTADMLSLSWMSAASDLPPVAPKEGLSESPLLKAQGTSQPDSRPRMVAGAHVSAFHDEHEKGTVSDAAPPPLVSPASLAEAGLESQLERMRPRMNTHEPSLTNHHQRRRMILGTALGCTIALIAGVAIYFRDKPSIVPQIEQPTARPLEADAKIAERLTDRTGTANTERTVTANANPPAQSLAPKPEIAVAQKAFLYEETEPGKDNAAYIGRTIWRTDMVSSSEGRPLEVALRADVDLPDAGLTLTMLLRKNSDAALPASHILQMTFAKTASVVSSAQRTVKDAGVPQFKTDEAARGIPLAGLPVPIADGVFLIGLSNVPNDITRNLDLLATKTWMDIPLRYANGRKAVLAIEKGLPGERAVSEAFKAWKDTP